MHDIGIIGAGVFGMCAAWAARQRGLSVVIHEAGRPGCGASGGLIGALSPHMPEKWNAKKAFQRDALLAAEAFWGAIATASNTDPGYRRAGRILPLHTERSRGLAEARAREAEGLWAGQATWRVVEERPGLAPSAHGYVYETLSAQIYPLAAMQALNGALQAQGVALAPGVAHVDEVRARNVIVAAGHRSGGLLLDLPQDFVTGVKGQSALLEPVLPVGAPIVFDDGVYVVAHADGVAVGSTSEKTWETDAPDARLDAVVDRARALVPALAGAAVQSRWAGIRPRARLPDPALGGVPGRPGVWLMTGGFKIGLALAPQLGAAIIEMILGEGPDLPDSFHLETQLAREAP